MPHMWRAFGRVVVEQPGGSEVTAEQFGRLMAELQTIRHLLIALLDQDKPEPQDERPRYL